eukprot:3361099-Rhodomonas_salina.4
MSPARSHCATSLYAVPFAPLLSSLARSTDENAGLLVKADNGGCLFRRKLICARIKALFAA